MEQELEEIKLSKKQGKNLLYYVFIGCLMAAFVAVIVVCFPVIVSRKNEAQDVQEIMETIYAYFSEATDEEYDKIAEKIRHDLVLRKQYSADKLKYLDYIPNTAEGCLAEPEDFPYQACLLSLNTGQMYQLDIYDEGIEETGISVKWGYDEISETGIQITADSNNGTGTAVIDSGRGIVSVQRMKGLFCDECIRSILEVNENMLEPELVLYNAADKEFYPIESGNTYQCGDYKVNITYNEQGEYELSISSEKES